LAESELTPLIAAPLLYLKTRALELVVILKSLALRGRTLTFIPPKAGGGSVRADSTSLFGPFGLGQATGEGLCGLRKRKRSS